MRLVRWLVRWVPVEPRGRRAAGEVLADWRHEATLAASGLTRLGVAVRALAALARTLGFVTVLERLPGTGRKRPTPRTTGDPPRRLSIIDTLLKDLRYAVRTLAKSPAFTAVVVLSLALGIGATSTIFSALNPILLRPLPFDDPDRLVYISDNSPDAPDVGKPPRFATYLEWKEHNSAFEQLESVRSTPCAASSLGHDSAIRREHSG